MRRQKTDELAARSAGERTKNRALGFSVLSYCLSSVLWLAAQSAGERTKNRALGFSVLSYCLSSVL
ncbi:MAG: hypothetical protein LBD06_06375 [Candidatus Accumulibacter sp.]|nr:hypothetical protein [Accumulibacter sp.]